MCYSQASTRKVGTQFLRGMLEFAHKCVMLLSILHAHPSRSILKPAETCREFAPGSLIFLSYRKNPEALRAPRMSQRPGVLTK